MSLSALRYPFIAIVFASAAYADPNAEEQAFLAVSGAAWSYTNSIPHELNQSALPAAMLKPLTGYDWGTKDGSLPGKFHGFTLDLNKDGKKEYFIETIRGGSGGPDYMILTQASKGWQVIGDYQGVLHVLAAKSGWPKLVITRRGGGNNYSKTNLEFQNGTYTRTILEKYERGKITKQARPE